MLQFYFLTIAANVLGGMTLSADWLAGKFPGMSPIVYSFSGRRGKLVAGLGALLVGFATLFVPTEPPIILGDLFPSLMGMAMGVVLLFEVFKQDAFYPAERGDTPERTDRQPIGYRTTLGMIGLVSALLHFFLPERFIL